MISPLPSKCTVFAFGPTEKLALREFVVTKMTGLAVIAVPFARGEQLADDEIQQVLVETS